MEPVAPDYDGASIVGVVPALVRGTRPSWFPEVARDRGPVVLLLLDGLGWTALEAHRSLLPRLGGLEGQAITTVAPSTTASALTSLVSGLTPAEHGIVGFRMRVDGSVLNVLRWNTDTGPGPDPFTVQRHDAFLGRPVPVVTKSEFRSTKFTEAHLRGTRFVGWQTTSTLVQQCRRLIGEGERLVYAYYPGVDSVAHEFGLHDEFFRAELVATDRLVGDLLDALPSNVTLLVTSDHGQVHIGAAGWVGLEPLRDLVDSYAGDGRFRYLYARRGASRELLAAAREEYGHQAWVLSRDELADGGWLGPAPVRAAVRRRLGDVVLAAHEPVGFVDPTLPREAGLVAGHGSLTPDEMLVPLVAARGAAR
ncbi:MAG: alkaline phosphatase family protein [Actinobacteria bacterium]|nr:alkaline phosphatase family protein [Actinomycetota bacterium]